MINKQMLITSSILIVIGFSLSFFLKGYQFFYINRFGAGMICAGLGMMSSSLIINGCNNGVKK